MAFDFEFDKDAFTALDYSVFGAMLGISALIGIYFAFCAREKQNTTSEYLMGGKNIGVFPISMSLVASYISGIALMGLPSEIYTFGTQITLALISEILGNVFCALTFVPVLHNLNIVSSYEYLELRFNSSLRKLGSFLFIILNMLYMPIVIYVPALAFSQASGLSLTLVISVSCAVCIFYTTLGGLKAVVWTDTFQTGMMILGVIAVAVIGTMNVGGLKEVWRRNDESERIEFFNTTFDVTIRHTMWNVVFGRFFAYVALAAVNQSLVQRYLATPTIRDAQITVLIMALGILLLEALSFYTGLVIFAAFWKCDPLTLGTVKKADGILPYFVMKYTRDIPALPGIFMAGIFSAGLSTMSTCLNSMCGVVYEDFIKPSLKRPLSEGRASLLMKVLVVVIGVLTVLLATIVEKLGGVIQTTASFSGITLGTLLGIYLLGMFVPWANSKGALVGGIAATGLVGWISTGAQWAMSQKQIVHPWKPFTIDGCDNATLSTYYASNDTIASTEISPEEPLSIFKLSYILYAPLGVFTCMFVGFIVSWATGFQDTETMNPALLCPIIRGRFGHKYQRKQSKKWSRTSRELADLISNPK